MGTPALVGNKVMFYNCTSCSLKKVFASDLLVIELLSKKIIFLVEETNVSDGFSKSLPNLSDSIKHILISQREMKLVAP